MILVIVGGDVWHPAPPGGVGPPARRRNTTLGTTLIGWVHIVQIWMINRITFSRVTGRVDIIYCKKHCSNKN